MWNYFDVYFHNVNFIRKLPVTDDFLNLCKRNTKIFQSQSIQIIRLVSGITKFHDSDYVKIQKIHDWVAMHIFYDMDVLKNGIYLTMDISAVETLLNKKGVCSGYSNLSVALLRCIGIPAIGVTCITNTATVYSKRQEDQINHEICMAFVNKKWIFIDSTWDSTNKFEDGLFKENINHEASRNYFDCSIDFFSKTHKLVGCILE